MTKSNLNTTHTFIDLLWLILAEDVFISDVHLKLIFVHLLRNHRKKDKTDNRTCLRIFTFLCFLQYQYYSPVLADYIHTVATLYLLFTSPKVTVKGWTNTLAWSYHPSPNSNRQCICSAEQSREEAAVWSIWRSICTFSSNPPLQPQSPCTLPKLPQRLWGGHFPWGTLQHFLRRKVSHRWAVVLVG